MSLAESLAAWRERNSKDEEKQGLSPEEVDRVKREEFAALQRRIKDLPRGGRVRRRVLRRFRQLAAELGS